MKNYILIVLMLILSCSTAVGQDNKKLEEEAIEAFYKIFNAYRSANCDSVISYLNDSIIFINNQYDTIFKTSEIINNEYFCSNVFEKINKDLTDSIHMRYYSVLTFTAKEFSKLKDKDDFNDSIFQRLSVDMKMALGFLAYKSHLFNDNDIFVTGVEPKRTEDFYTEDSVHKKNLPYEISFFSLYFFVLRKTEDGWKILAISN